MPAPNSIISRFLFLNFSIHFSNLCLCAYVLVLFQAKSENIRIFGRASEPHCGQLGNGSLASKLSGLIGINKSGLLLSLIHI